MRSGGQALAACFGSKRNEEQPNRECDRRQRDGNSQRTLMLHARSYKKCDPCSAEPREGRTESKRTRAAFRRILFRQPERIDSEVRAAQSKKEKTNKKPRQRRWTKVENLAKRQRNERHHESEIESQRSAPPEFLGEPRHRHAPHNRRKRHEHSCARSKLCRLPPHAPCGFRERRRCRTNVNRSRPKPADGSQHIQRIQ